MSTAVGELHACVQDKKFHEFQHRRYTTGSGPTSATLVHDVDNRPLLAVLSQHAQRVLVLTLPPAPWGGAPVAVETVLDTDALAIASVAATRNARPLLEASSVLDLLVLRPNGTLALFWGAHCMVNVTVNATVNAASMQATPPGYVGYSDTGGGYMHAQVCHARIVGRGHGHRCIKRAPLPCGACRHPGVCQRWHVTATRAVQDAVGDRCTLVDGSGARIRIHLGWKPTGVRTQRVLHALAAVLPVDDYVALYARLLHQRGMMLEVQHA